MGDEVELEGKEMHMKRGEMVLTWTALSLVAGLACMAVWWFYNLFMFMYDNSAVSAWFSFNRWVADFFG